MFLHAVQAVEHFVQSIDFILHRQRLARLRFKLRIGNFQVRIVAGFRRRLLGLALDGDGNVVSPCEHARPHAATEEFQEFALRRFFEVEAGWAVVAHLPDVAVDARF